MVTNGFIDIVDSIRIDDDDVDVDPYTLIITRINDHNNATDQTKSD